MAHTRVDRVGDIMKEGDEIEVKVIEVGRDGKIRLSRRELLPLPEGEEGERAKARICQPREAGPPPSRGPGGGGRDRERTQRMDQPFDAGIVETGLVGRCCQLGTQPPRPLRRPRADSGSCPRRSDRPLVRARSQREGWSGRGNGIVGQGGLRICRVSADTRRRLGCAQPRAFKLIGALGGCPDLSNKHQNLETCKNRC
jgi:hypothetical protein